MMLLLMCAPSGAHYELCNMTERRVHPFLKQSTFSNCFINSICKCRMTGSIQMLPVNFTWKSNFWSVQKTGMIMSGNFPIFLCKLSGNLFRGKIEFRIKAVISDSIAKMDWRDDQEFKGLRTIFLCLFNNLNQSFGNRFGRSIKARFTVFWFSC